jgi:hypothetical protein
VFALRPAHEQSHARTISERTSIKREANFCSCKHPPKKPTTRGKTKPLGSQRVGHENTHLGVTWLGHFVRPFGKEVSISTYATRFRKIGQSS